MNLEQVNEFVFLGSMFERKGHIGDEIMRRANAGLKVVGAFGRQARNENL